MPCPEKIQEWRTTAFQIVTRRDPRLAILVGPCSVHDPIAALEYAKKLSSLSQELASSFFLVMRLFIEKPRTRLGWKGLLYDPNLNASHEIEQGLYISRKLMLEIAEIGVPSCAEILEPLAIHYWDDLLSWGIIGARTSGSQIHRQVASLVSFPVGFKNDLQGHLDSAIFGISSANASHVFLSVDEEGRVAKIQSRGNPYCHLILRGKENGPNYDSSSREKALLALSAEGLFPTLAIDCSHGNSKKDHHQQSAIFRELIEEKALCALMLESNLFAGKQSSFSHPLHYGVSITDSCMGWEETAELLRSMSMRLVQK